MTTLTLESGSVSMCGRNIGTRPLEVWLQTPVVCSRNDEVSSINHHQHKGISI